MKDIEVRRLPNMMKSQRHEVSLHNKALEAWRTSCHKAKLCEEEFGCTCKLGMNEIRIRY